MAYHIARNGQTYGPYTLDDLERYIASGHVLLQDQARSDDTAEWTTVAELPRAAGRTPVAPVHPSVTFQPAPGIASAGPAFVPQVPLVQAAALNNPPNLHWALVLLFDCLTCSFFQMVWNIIMGAWFRRVSPGSKALWLYIASAVLIVIQGITGQALGFMSGRYAGSGPPFDPRGHYGVLATYGLIALVAWITRLVARFTFRSELEQHFNTVDPIGLQINPVLTFFFGGLYLQSVLNRINETKRLQLYGVLPR